MTAARRPPQYAVRPGPGSAAPAHLGGGLACRQVERRLRSNSGLWYTYSVQDRVGAEKTEMDAESITSLAFGIAVLAFLWNLHRDIGLLSKDISDLRDRVSRIEGMLAGAGLKIGPGPASG